MSASNPKLTEGQHRFAELLRQFPKIAAYWDVPNNSYDRDRLQSDMGAWSHGEQILTRFFMMVWHNTNKEANFDIVDAAAILDPDKRRIITYWFLDPFWP